MNSSAIVDIISLHNLRWPIGPLGTANHRRSSLPPFGRGEPRLGFNWDICLKMKKNTNFLIWCSLTFIGFIVTIFILKMIDRIDLMAFRRAGGEDVSVKIATLTFIAVEILIYFLLLLIQKKFLRAFCLLIILLPVTSLAEKVFYIVAHTRIGGGQQRLSLTTLMIFVQLLFMFIHRPSFRRITKNNGRFQALLLSFAACVTVSQFINHSIYESVMLSIGAIWQYVALFYIMIMLVDKEEHVRTILKIIIFAFLWNICFRYAISDQISTAVMAGEEISRVSGLAFGPAVSYSGYVACLIMICIYFITSSKSKIQKFFWCLIAAVFVIEIGNANTRGALLSLVIGIMFLLSRRKYRKSTILISVILVALYIGAINSNLIDPQRNFIEYQGKGDVEIHGPQLRWEIFLNYLPHFFDNYGFGIGMGYDPQIDIQIGTKYRVLSAHNMIEDLAITTGGISAIMFLYMFGYACIKILSIAKMKKQHSDVLIFILATLLTWFFFANSTGTSIVYYYPYEAIIIFYLVFYSGIILAEAHPAMQRRSRIANYLKRNEIQCAQDKLRSVYTASLH
jgi:hypothetical protein